MDELISQFLEKEVTLNGTQVASCMGAAIMAWLTEIGTPEGDLEEVEEKVFAFALAQLPEAYLNFDVDRLEGRI